MSARSSKKSKNLAPAEAARIGVGLSLEEAARCLRMHPRTLRSYELHGNASLSVARRISALYGGCDGNMLVYPSSYYSALKSNAQPGQLPGAAAAPRQLPLAAAGADTRTSASRRYSRPKQPVLAVLKGGVVVMV
jgi:hypothetical protein